MSGGDKISADLEAAQQTDHARDVEQPVESEDDLPGVDEFVIPDGDQYSLMSKRLKPACIHQVAEALGLPTVLPPRQDVRRIEEKLTEMGYEPESVQVIIQGRGDDASMFLVNDTGIIKMIECVKAGCRAHDHDETSSESADSRSALRDARHGETVVESESRSGEIEQLRQDLQLALAEADQERALTAQKEEQIRVLQNALEKEKRKSKRFWRDKCEQLLNYEEDLEAKDAEIALLKAQLITATASGRRGHVDREIVSPHSMQDDASRARLTPTTTHHSLSSYSSSSEPRVQFQTQGGVMGVKRPPLQESY